MVDEPLYLILIGNLNFEITSLTVFRYLMLEGLCQEEADLLIWAKDGELNKHYKGLTGNLVKEAFNWNDDFMRKNA